MHDELAAINRTRKALDDREKALIEQILETKAWNVSAAATVLEISRYALQRKLRRFGLVRCSAEAAPQFSRPPQGG